MFYVIQDSCTVEVVLCLKKHDVPWFRDPHMYAHWWLNDDSVLYFAFWPPLIEWWFSIVFCFLTSSSLGCITPFFYMFVILKHKVGYANLWLWSCIMFCLKNMKFELHNFHLLYMSYSEIPYMNSCSMLQNQSHIRIFLRVGSNRSSWRGTEELCKEKSSALLSLWMFNWMVVTPS